MTKGELRQARKAAHARGETFETAGDRDQGAVSFSESPRGREARDRWARAYDDLNGAPENDDDR